MKLCLSWLIWGFILFIPPVLFAQTITDKPDYREIFGEDYEYAVKTLQDNSRWADSLRKDGIDADFALSIIFPELIRFSSISDFIEVKALEVLYVQYGENYADFSVGLFQMKPSLAGQIEADILRLHLIERFPSLDALIPDTLDNLQLRKERIIRLKNEEGQLRYLEAFIRIMDTIYSEMTFNSTEDKLMFYATAYNTGYWEGDQVIRGAGNQAYFYVGMIEPEVKYNYADIAVDYFLKFKK